MYRSHDSGVLDIDQGHRTHDTEFEVARAEEADQLVSRNGKFKVGSEGSGRTITERKNAANY